MMALLARASVDGAILVAAVWIASRVLRLSPATRTALWWCAAAKFVLALAWTTPVAVPILPADAVVQRSTAGAFRPGPASIHRARAGAPISAGSVADGLREWTSVAAIGWTIGIGLVTIVAVRRWRQTARLFRTSAPADGHVQELARDLASRLDLRRIPEVRVSPDVETPLVTGLAHPVVIVPTARFEALTDRQRQMALCHELAHLKRADLLFGCVPALAERLFFFHPLAHVASREYALAREAACDAAVVETLDAAPQEYGELLLALGVSTPRTSLTAAGAAWSFQHLKRRIAMLQDISGRSKRSRLIAAGVVGVAAAAMVPMQIVARPAPAGQPSVSAAAAQPQQRREPAAPETDDRLASAAPEIVEAQESKDRLLSFVLLDKGSQITSGPDEDAGRARRHQQDGAPLLWFRNDGREYVVRDAEILRLVRSLMAPLVDIGFDHGAIAEMVKSLNVEALAEQGRQMAEAGKLAAEQGRIAAEEGAIGAHVGAIMSEQAMRALAESGAAIAGAERHASDAHRQSLDDSRHEIDERMRELEERLTHDIGDQMRELQERVRALEGPIREMTAPLEQLDHHMKGFAFTIDESARKAREDVRKLLEDAIASGLARPVR